jgi:hypothetical protein
MVADPTPSATDESPGETSPTEPASDAAAGDVAGADAAAASRAEQPEAPVLEGTDDGARELLSQFVAPNADHAALTRALRPTAGDYKVLFDAQTAPKIEAEQAREWNSNKAVIKPKPGQTEVKVWSATGSDLSKGTGNAKEFPGGYKKIAKHLAPDVLFFRFKFVEPGKDTGTAYDGLAFINGRWVIAPKPWRALEGKGGGTDSDADEKASSNKGSKPKPKSKPKRGKKR